MLVVVLSLCSVKRNDLLFCIRVLVIWSVLVVNAGKWLSLTFGKLDLGIVGVAHTLYDVGI